MHTRAVLWIALFLVSAGAVAQAADPFRVIPLIRDNKVLVSFDLSDGFTNEVRDAIKSGLQTTITYTVELRVEAPLWVDRTMASAIVSTTVHFDNLTRQHTVVRTLDGRVEDTRVTEDDALVKQLMTTAIASRCSARRFSNRTASITSASTHKCARRAAACCGRGRAAARRRPSSRSFPDHRFRSILTVVPAYALIIPTASRRTPRRPSTQHSVQTESPMSHRNVRLRRSFAAFVILALSTQISSVVATPANPPNPCEQLLKPNGNAEGLHKRCDGIGGGGGAAKGDFNGDGVADLAIGVPYEDQNGVNAVGGVNIIYGSSTGLTSGSVTIPNDQFLDETTFGFPYTSNDHFGWALASGDFNGDTFSDLAIGMPDWDLNLGGTDHGVVFLIDGSPTGLRPPLAAWHRQSAAWEDVKGAALVWADFNGDGFGDLAIGQPNAKVKSDGLLCSPASFDVKNAGQVQVLYGSATSLGAFGAQVFRQGSCELLGGNWHRRFA